MWQLGGIELVARLCPISATPILALSLHAAPLYITLALDAGAQGYVSEKASPEEMLAAIRRMGSHERYIEHELAKRWPCRLPPRPVPKRSLA